MSTRPKIATTFSLPKAIPYRLFKSPRSPKYPQEPSTVMNCYRSISKERFEPHSLMEKTNAVTNGQTSSKAQATPKFKLNLKSAFEDRKVTLRNKSRRQSRDPKN